MSQLLSGKVKVVRPSEVSEDRYEFLRLGEAEPNLGVPESGSIDSGSFALVASDADGNRLFVTTIQLDEVSGSFSGSFAGDGSQLNNLPDVQQLRSGSVSASISPSTGFLVNASASIDGDLDLDGTARITGDLIVDNRIVAREIIVEIISSSIIFSSGSNKFGDELTDKQEFTGSVDITGSLRVDGDTNITGAVGIVGDTDVIGLVGIQGNTTITGSIFVSQSIEAKEFSGSFSGSGANLFDIPFSALTDNSPLIASGAVTASTEDNQFIVTSVDSGSLFIGDVKLDSGSVFSGSGRDLFDIPKSALAPDALVSPLIATGSVSASVSTDGFFRVEGTGSVTSEFSGSIFVSGAIQLNSGSAFSGSGENLFNIPRSALAPDALQSALIISGSVTASVDPQEGFVVTSVASGSTFSGSIFVSGAIQLNSGSSFSGSGANLFDIPRSALTEDALISNLITTGSITASVSTDGFFRVEGTGSVTTELSGSLFVSGNVQLNSGSAFSGSGENLFNIPRSALTEDALLSTEIVSGSVTASVSPNEGFVVTSIDSGSKFFGDITLSSGSKYSGSGANLFDIPRSALTEDALETNLIISGAVTASVDPQDGFVVTSRASGSLFIGDVRLESGSVFSGSGRDLFDIPRSALTDDAILIASGAITASTEEGQFTVTSLDSGSFFIGDVQLQSGSVFSGSGEKLFDIPFSALSDDAQASIESLLSVEAGILASGSVTASVSDERGFVVISEASGSTFSGSVFLSSGSFYAGSGENLFNIPFSALSDDAQTAIEALVTREAVFIASGSVTASTENNQFIVESLESGSLFFGDVKLDSGSVFSGSGRDLFDIPESALAFEINKIASGSVTASVSPNEGFVVTSPDSGSTFDGDVRLLSGSVFSGSGRDLFDIPRTALTDDALISNLISTGSVTASVTTDGFFRVEGTGSITSEFSGSVLISESLDVPIITATKISADEFSGSFSGSFAGDGSRLNNIPQTALSEDAVRIASGSVTASVSPNLGFVVNTSGSIQGDLTVDNDLFVGGRITATEIFTQFISSSTIISTGSNVLGDNSGSDTQTLFGDTNIYGNVTASGFITSSGFVGDGAGLFNIPQSALSEDAVLIASGAVTASTEDNQFIVTSVDSGSLFIGNVEIPSGSGFFSGSGEGLFNIPESALAFEINRISSGSVTASVSPVDGFVVNTSGSIQGKLVVDSELSASVFSGSGAGLFDIPLSAITEEAFRIASGSVTASVDPNRGFEVNSTGRFEDSVTITGSLIVSSSRDIIPTSSINTIFNITAPDSSNYVFSGGATGNDPELTLVKDVTYTFNINASGHPFYIKGQSGTDTANALTGSQFDGFNGTDSGSFTFTPTGSNTTIYYNCSVHSSMGNSISLVETLYNEVVPNRINGQTIISGALDVTETIDVPIVRADEFSGSFSGSGRDLFDIPLSALAEDITELSFIASGSVTASTDPEYGFKVNTSASIEGDLYVTGGLEVNTSSSFFDNVVISASLEVSESITTEKLIATSITSSFLTSSVVDFVIGENTYASVPGRLKWNEADGTLDLGMGGGSASLQLGQELYYPYVVNKEGSDLVNGTLVMVDPSQPAEGNRLRVVRAITDGTYPEDFIVGVLTEDIANNQQGFATWFGYVRELNIEQLESGSVKETGSAWTEGSILYPNPAVSGGLTPVKPEAPNLKTSIAAITRVSGQNITLLVRPHLGNTLGGLHDVQIASASNNDILVYVSESQRWEKETMI